MRLHFFNSAVTANSKMDYWVSNLKFQTLRIETWVTVNVLLSSILCYIDSIIRSTTHWLKTKSKISFLNSLLYWYLWKSQKWYIFQYRWSSSARLHWSFRRRFFLAAYPQGFFVGTFELQHCLQWWSGNENMTGLEKTKLNSTMSFGQAALTLWVPGATFFVVNGLVRGWIIMVWSHWASKL